MAKALGQDAVQVPHCIQVLSNSFMWVVVIIFLYSFLFLYKNVGLADVVMIKFENAEGGGIMSV